MHCIYDVVNIEFDTKPNPFMCIWVQKSEWQSIDGLHSQGHWKHDIPFCLVSNILVSMSMRVGQQKLWIRVKSHAKNIMLATYKRLPSYNHTSEKKSKINGHRSYLRGIEHYLSGRDLHERRFGWYPSESIGNLTSLIFMWVSLFQWSHCEPWKYCFELLDPNRWKGANYKMHITKQCILDVASIEFDT